MPNPTDPGPTMEHLQRLLPAILGSILAAFFNREAGFGTMIAAALAGMATSYWGTPWVGEWLHLSDKAMPVCGFVMGLTGMWIVRNLIQDPIGFFQRMRNLALAALGKGNSNGTV